MDWTVYTNRRRLIKVLRYAQSQGLLKVTDGSDDLFMEDTTGEVLYENTGASRYFMRNFSRDIMEYTAPEDFNESEWFNMDEERGSPGGTGFIRGFCFRRECTGEKARKRILNI